MAIYKLLSSTRFTLLTLVVALMTACSSTSEIKEVNNDDYGPFPENNQEIVKAYLETKASQDPLNPSTIRFLNTPDKYIYSEFGRQKEYGYRVCTLITTESGRKTKSHFFLIQNDEVIQHRHDMGLVSLSDDFCDIQRLATSNETNVVASETSTKASVNEDSIKYILCDLNGNDKFFAFNPGQHQLQEEQDGNVVANYNIEQLSDTFIIATGDNNSRVAINRISGSVVYKNGEVKSRGSCELTRKQKF